jgi:hypothetical protein
VRQPGDGAVDRGTHDGERHHDDGEDDGDGGSGDGHHRGDSEPVPETRRGRRAAARD